MSNPKRTRRTPEQMAQAREVDTKGRTTEREEKQPTRQRMEKPLQLDISHITSKPEFKGKVFKWVDYENLDYNLGSLHWEIVKNISTKVNHNFTPDGRKKLDETQSDDGGAYTKRVGTNKDNSPRYNFLLMKDLERYNAEDAVWNKEEADRPMDTISDAAGMGERAGLGVDVYQPNEKTTIEKRSEY